jgi:hypothetical protein
MSLQCVPIQVSPPLVVCRAKFVPCHCVFLGLEEYTCSRAYRHGVICLLKDVTPHPTNAYEYDMRAVRDAESKGIRVLRLFVELYIDGFGTWRKVQYSPDGIYISFGNESRQTRNQLDNIHCLGMKPPNTNMNDCLAPIVEDLKKLQTGFLVTVAGHLVFVIGGLGIVKADMPQAQELAGCMSMSCGRPCRMCHVQKGADLGDMDVPATESRVRSIWTKMECREAQCDDSNALTDTGLAKEASILEDRQLCFDETVGIPTEPLHSELSGISKLALSLLVASLTVKFRRKLSLALARLKTPWKTQLPPFELSRKGSVKMNAEQVCRVIQVLPFLLTAPSPHGDGRPREWLQKHMFTSEACAAFEAKIGSRFCTEVRLAFIAVAASNVMVFAEERTNDMCSLKELDESVRTARRTLQEVFGDTFERPNTHAGLHLVDAADRFAVPKNCDVRMYETKHGPFKRVMARSNGRGVEKQMMMWSNTRQALCFLARGGTPARCDALSQEMLSHIREDPALARLLQVKTVKSPHGNFSTQRPRKLDAKHVMVAMRRLIRKGWRGSTDISAEEASSCGLSPGSGTLRASLWRGQNEVLPLQHWEVLTGPHESERFEVKAPIGPRPGVAIARIRELIWYCGRPFARVHWLARCSTQPQQLTGCHTYQLRESYSRVALVPMVCFHRPVHILEQGIECLLNRFFIK